MVAEVLKRIPENAPQLLREVEDPFPEYADGVDASELALGDDSTGLTGGERTPTPLTDDEVAAIVETELSNTSAEYSGELAENRMAALRYYEGNMASPPAGRSVAVSTDVADVVEWTMPQVMSALVGSENVVLFDAVSEEDEPRAQLETDACNHVIFQQNQGFLYYYSMVKDALLQKNGIGKVWWDDAIAVDFTSYTGYTEEEVQALLNPEDGSQVEMIEGEPSESMPSTYDVTVRTYTPNQGVKVAAMPPEEFLVNRDHDSIDLTDARFTAHKRLATESELIAEGWDIELVRDLPTYSVDTTGEREERRSLEDEKDWGYDASSEAVRRIQVIECYAHIDQDGDGIAELLQVHVAGEAGYMFMGWDRVSSHPFVATTPFLLTHKFYGYSLFDKVKEIQDQKTSLTRAIQDNLDHQNNARTLVVAGQVNLDDMLTSRPGGIVRQKQPGMVEPLVAPQIGELGYRQLEYLDNVRTGRVGVSPDTASVVEAIAGDTAHGLERLMSAKEELTGLIIRLMANTAVRGTLLKTRGLLSKHRDTPMHFKARGKWQEVNPSEWKNRTGATVATSLSHGDRMKKANGLGMVLQQQEKVWAMGGDGILVTMDNIHNTLTDFARATHVGDPTPYWTDPSSPEAQQAMQAKQAQAQQAQQAQQDQARGMVMAQMQIETMQEETKRLTAELKDAQEAKKLSQDLMTENAKLKKDYTQMEIDAAVNIAGQGQETAPSPWGQ